MGKNVSYAPEYATSVNRILNFSSGAITPQFHVVYDEHFTTFHTNGSAINWDPAIWAKLVQSGHEQRSISQDKTIDGHHAFEQFYKDFLKANGVEGFVREGDELDNDEISISRPDVSESPPPEPVLPADEGAISQKVKEKLLRDLGPLNP